MRALLLTAALVLPMMLASAQECEMTTTSAEIDSGVLYVDVECIPFSPCILQAWIYRESNGIPGLQRADEVHDDTCGGAAGPGDTIIF